MYLTGAVGSRGTRITSLRCYTNELELANFIRRCRRQSLEQTRRHKHGIY